MAEIIAQWGLATVFAWGWNRPWRIEGPNQRRGGGFFDSSENSRLRSLSIPPISSSLSPPARTPALARKPAVEATAPRGFCACAIHGVQVGESRSNGWGGFRVALLPQFGEKFLLWQGSSMAQQFEQRIFHLGRLSVVR